MKKIAVLSLITIIWAILAVFVFEHTNSKAVTSWVHKKILNVQYAHDGNAQMLDIYYPNEGIGPFPAIIAIHGGAFKFGDKTDAQIQPMLEGLKKGYAVVSINYRMIQDARWPAQVDDVKTSVKFIRVNAQRLDIKPDRIALWGAPSSGNIAVLAGVSADTKSLEDENLSANDVLSAVQAVVDWYGPVDFVMIEKQSQVVGSNKPSSGKTDEIPMFVHNSDAEDYVSPNEPPVFIEYVATSEGAIPPDAKEFFDAMKERSKSEIIFENIQSDKDFASRKNLEKVFKFLDKYLK